MIWTIVIGFVIGLVARAVKPGADSLGWILTILIGIGGSYLGSLLYPAGGTIVGFAISVACAVVLLFAYEAVRGKTAKS